MRKSLFDSRLIPAWIVLAVLIAFALLPTCQFTNWDDPATVAANPRLNPPSLQNIAWYWTHPHRGLYVPISYTLWSAIAAVAQSDLPNSFGSHLRPSLFHTANLLLHITSALLVYAILLRLLKKQWPASLAALLFALHPVQVEPVAWVSGLKDILCGTLTLAAIWQYLVWARDDKKWPTALLATVCFIAAILSKPTAIVAPMLVWAIDYWLIRRPLRQTLLLPVLWTLLAIPIAIITHAAQQSSFVEPVPLHCRPLIAADALTFYLRQIIWPAHLAIDYSRRPSVVLTNPITKVIWTVPVILALLIICQRRRRPWLTAAAILFVAPLLPVLGLQPFMMQFTSTVADHYLYLPMFALALAAGYWLAAQNDSRRFTIAGAIVIALAVRSAMQTRYWHDDLTLNQHTLAINPDSFTAHINLAHDFEINGNFISDLAECQAAVRCNPNFPLARSNDAVMLATLGHLDQAVEQCLALEQLLNRLPSQEQRRYVHALNFVGRELLWHHQSAKAATLLHDALRIDPADIDAASDLEKAKIAIQKSNSATVAGEPN